ncbi:hypothetical protein BT69DRAFT_1296173 [Atractiella rhizophila]|nr:hypothetical protein BT69DRAFT_1296173 [Atractiella rhizophila]
MYKKTVALLDQLDSQAEDNNDPFHAAFSGWFPSSPMDIGYQDWLKAFATLWKRLHQVSSIPEVTLRAPKACLCAAAEHIHATLLSEDGSKKKNKWTKLNSGGDSVTRSTFMANIPLITYNPRHAVVRYFYHSVNWSEVPGYLKPKHKTGDKYFRCNHCVTVLRSSMASNGNTKTLSHHLSDHHGRTVARFFALIKEKRARKMEITEEELRKAAGTVPIKRKDRQNSRKKVRGMNEILRRVAQKYESQTFEPTIFADLLNILIVEEDLLFSIVDSPALQELFIYLQWILPSANEIQITDLEKEDHKRRISAQGGEAPRHHDPVKCRVEGICFEILDSSCEIRQL